MLWPKESCWGKNILVSLPVIKISNNQVHNFHCGNIFTAGDCWELGRQSYNNGDHYHTVLWMGEALNKWDDESNKTVAREDILDYLSFSTFKQGGMKLRFHLKLSLIYLVTNLGNVKEALLLTNELLQIVPYHQRAIGNKKHYEDILRKEGILLAIGPPNGEGER
jgi:prolyl 4-hydroxylase